uniref:Uncharacterized protein n=1 Tax=mine drainage metagenome TaxID=410659 RepID=E6QVQ0_9ZZZZ
MSNLVAKLWRKRFAVSLLARLARTDHMFPLPERVVLTPCLDV